MSTNPLGLFPFQTQAVDHLSLRQGRLIADDPGTGKTYMAGELDRLLRVATHGVKPTLIIAPKAMLYTWGGWYADKQPDVRVSVMDPKSAATRALWTQTVKDRTADVYIVHYEGLKKELGEIEKVHWGHIIVDEAHRIANRKTDVSKAVRCLTGDWRTALTGTPADRAPDQLWSILNFLEPAAWRSYWNFRQRYITEYIDPDGDGYRTITAANPLTAGELRQRLAPIMVRRRKEEVLPDLPPKVYQNVWVDLSPKQRKVYDQMRDNMIAWVGEHEDEPLQAAVVIAQLIRLQQIALATPVFVTRTRWVKQYWPNEDPYSDDEYLRDRQGRRISEGLDKVEEEFVEIHLEDPSSKIDAAMDIIQERIDAGEKVIVFSQFTRAIDLLCERLEKADIWAGKYTGQTSHATRTKIEQEFSNGDLMVFAAQIDAGGTGLNLQAASTIIFLDVAWKPGTDLQAEDRIHRIGQLAPFVTIIFIMARGTVDRGRHQHIRRNWRSVQELLGDKYFDWTHSLEDPAEESEPAIQENP